MSGAANCPETPRQKMIGMMYLVLTAMLALNVSAEVLQGFVLMSKSLNETNADFLRYNQGLLGEIEDLYAQNPTKVAEWLEKAKEVEQKSNEVYNFIEEYKLGLIQTCDGKHVNMDSMRNGYIVKKMDNIDVAKTYSYGGRGAELKAKLNEFSIYVTEMFGSDSANIVKFQKAFSTEPVRNNSGLLQPWEDAMFESMPVISVTTQLSNLQEEVFSAQEALYRYFIAQTDAGDYRVNKIEAFVIPTSKVVMQGGQYSATIALAAVDTTKIPDYYIGGSRLSSNKYSVNCNTVGSYQYSGKILLKGNDGAVKEFHFKENYEVIAPTVTVANIDMNVVYMGYDNKIAISVPGVSDNHVEIESNATTKRTDKYYVVVPKTNDDVVINVYATVDGKRQQMGASKFRVRTLPDPTVFIQYTDASGNKENYNSKSNKKPSRRELANGKLVAEYEDGLLQASFTITSFEMVTTNASGDAQTFRANNNTFTTDQQRMLMNQRTGSVVMFDRIQCTGAKATTLLPLSIKL